MRCEFCDGTGWVRLHGPRTSDEHEQLNQLLKDDRGFNVIPDGIQYNLGEHPWQSHAVQCAFASEQINQLKPKNILDIGSFRQWIIGVTAAYPVTSLDVRPRGQITSNETLITGDSRELSFRSASFDMV